MFEILIGKKVIDVDFKPEEITFLTVEHGLKKTIIIKPPLEEYPFVRFVDFNIIGLLGHVINSVKRNEKWEYYEFHTSTDHICVIEFTGIKNIIDIKKSNSGRELLIRADSFEGFELKIHYILINGEWTYGEFFNNNHLSDRYNELLRILDLPNHPSIRLKTLLET